MEGFCFMSIKRGEGLMGSRKMGCFVKCNETGRKVTENK
jgi:hypothetical protein